LKNWIRGSKMVRGIRERRRAREERGDM